MQLAGCVNYVVRATPATTGVVPSHTVIYVVLTETGNLVQYRQDMVSEQCYKY